MPVGSNQFTTCPQVPGALTVLMLAGEVKVGGSLSITVTENEQVPTFKEESVDE